MLDLAHFDLLQFEASAAAAARLLRALGNERRLMIMCQLAGGETTVGALQARIGVSQSALSQHLAVLRDDGLVATRRDGQLIYYRIDDAAAAAVITTLAAHYCAVESERTERR